jgi:hypothetical protein
MLTSKKTQHVHFTKTDWLMLLEEKSLSILRIVRNQEINYVGKTQLMNAKTSGTYIYHCALNS